MIYLDNAATTCISSPVKAVMLDYINNDEYGNPGGLYIIGRNSSEKIKKAREEVAKFINAEPNQIYFTSCGSEANNWVLTQVINKGFGYISSEIEHDSILNCLKELGCYYDVRLAKPEKDGTISIKAIRRLFRDFRNDDREVMLTSIMYVNNETGATNDVKEMCAFAHRKGSLFHTDCTQAVGTYKIDVKEMDCDFLTFSGHKIGAPKGIGVLYIKDKTRIHPMIAGGSAQEFGMRGGTENVMNIIALGEACRTIYDKFNGDIEKYNKYITELKSKFYDDLIEKLGKNLVYPVEKTVINGLLSREKGKILSLTFPGIDSEALTLLLDSKGVCVSSGSACTSREQKPSHVLVAMGVSEENARCTIRFSFSDNNTEEEIKLAAEYTAKCIEFLWNSRK